jgi:HD-like signal output (HDOD) protein/ActR/RegA family two-component response regulator
MKILVVDDELVSREKMKHIMSSLGECDEVSGGQDALKAFIDARSDGNHYDLITLDISMPEMDGTEVLNRIRTIEKNQAISKESQVKIFMVTASSEKDIILSCIKSGCNDYIMKPFSMETVVKKMKDNGLMEQQSQNGSSTGNESAQEKKNPLTKIIAQFNRGEIELPLMPQIQSKFFALMKAGANLQEIGGLLKQDPAISSKLISISNSSFYRGITENITVEQAISRLGLLATKQTVDAISNRSLYLGTNTKYTEVMEKLWEHALSCAHACQVIVEIKGIKLSEDPFTLGLLHDIGKLMLLRVMGEIEKKDKDVQVVSADELFESLNTHHGKTGAVLLKKWNFPGVYLQVAEFHDHISDTQSPSMELLVVHLANLIVKSIGYGSAYPEGTSPETSTSLVTLEVNPAQLESIKEQIVERVEGLKEYLK